ncbi:ComF family protein [uncultured Psychrobacter sp.]|uniref:ComF family protein n=1 Tax=uncultured Psychrobacter sp. TaxID=259303 RepID=UPI0026114A52|nr:ComF family protein [uncultured Psychrobacter sp.]
MQRLAPYQSGLWLAEYINLRCQLCHVYRSTASIPSSAAPSPHNCIQRYLYKGLLCARCHDYIVWLPKVFTVDIAAGASLTIQAATYYDYPIRQAIRAFKHSEDMTKLPLLVHVLRQLPRPVGCHSQNSVILPMPTTASRLVERGFDPVTILSTYLSKHWNIPIWQGVQRIDHTVSQQGLTRAERLTNLNDAFTLTTLPPVKRILIFDDVATTGASLQALARTLYIQTFSHNQTYPINPSTSHDKNTPISNIYHISAYALAHGSHDT